MRLLLLLITFSISFSCFSQDTWNCQVKDATGKYWEVQHKFRMSARNLAMDTCRKQSTAPNSCDFANQSCDTLYDGLSKDPLWVCLALDSTAKGWKNHPNKQKYDAALSAKGFCQHKSSVPETCYVNLLTCKDINPFK